MVFVRLEVHDEKGYSSMPFCFCIKCKNMYYMGAGNFCSRCGNKLDIKNKEPQIIKVYKKDNPTFNEYDFEAVYKYLMERINWNV